MMTHRNRSARGAGRNNGGNSQHGEEAQIWESCKAQMLEIVASINAENDNLGEIVSLDKKIGVTDPDKVATDLFRMLEDRSRAGVKFSETNLTMLKSVIEQLNVLRAVVLAKEQAEGGTSLGSGPSGSAGASGPSKRSTRDKGDGGAAAAAAAAALYDFEGAGDSPVPSPVAGGSAGRKHGDRASSTRDRDSMPPKADSVEPQGSIAGGSGGSGPGSAVSASGAAGPNGVGRRVIFSKGDTVAFKPKNTAAEATSDWILGEVAAVLGEGKSRRYKVLDVEPDEEPGKQKEYRTSASSMIAIAPESVAATLKPWEAGKLVLALYPQTTTFYRAEVHSMDEGGRMVNLKFEGENDSTTLQQVERRFVIEYRQ